MNNLELQHQQQIFIQQLQTTIAQQANTILTQSEQLKKLQATLPSISNDMPFISLLSEWLSKRKPFLQPNTYETYKSEIAHHLSPYFSNLGVTLQKLTSYDIEEYYSYEISRGLSPNSVIRFHSLIFSAFKYAEEKSYIIRNPMKKVKRPKSAPFIPNVYDANTINELFIATRHLKIYPAIILAATLGLRRSEIAGLTWDSINLNTGIVTIKQKMVKVRDEEQLSKRLKTETSYRCLSLPKITLDFLKRLKAKQDVSKQTCTSKIKIQNYKYVCIDEKGNRLSMQRITGSFRDFMDNSNNSFPKIRFHDLRHSCACILLNAGCNMKQVQEWLGHSNFAFTAKVYIHLSAKEKEYAASRLDYALNLDFEMSE